MVLGAKRPYLFRDLMQDKYGAIPFLSQARASEVLVLSGLIFKDVGNLADFLVIGRGDGGALLWGAARDAKGVPV